MKLDRYSCPSPLTHLLDMPCKVNDMILKHFLIKIERRTFFFCLQAVNYLTSTHNEQCKTSRNLIKRQRQGPSADGKWLTQLIKHPSVRLNMASLSHHLQKGWDPLHIYIFPFPIACGTFIAFIMLTPIYSAASIKVFMLVLTSLTNFLFLVNPNTNKFAVASLEENRQMPCNPSGIYGKVVWFCFSEGCYWEKFWQNTHTEFITQALQRKSNASSRSKHNRWETVQTPRHLSLIHSFSLASDWQSLNKKKSQLCLMYQKPMNLFSISHRRWL